MDSRKSPATDYSEEEAQRRFEKLVRTALKTPPKPMKDMPRKRPAPPGERPATDEKGAKAPAPANATRG